MHLVLIVSGFTYKKDGYQISATKIIGRTIYTNITILVEEKKNKVTQDFIYDNYGYTKKSNTYWFNFFNFY